jgi:hypothetical protein
MLPTIFFLLHAHAVIASTRILQTLQNAGRQTRTALRNAVQHTYHHHSDSHKHASHPTRGHKRNRAPVMVGVQDNTKMWPENPRKTAGKRTLKDGGRAGVVEKKVLGLEVTVDEIFGAEELEGRRCGDGEYCGVGKGDTGETERRERSQGNATGRLVLARRRSLTVIHTAMLLHAFTENEMALLHAAHTSPSGRVYHAHCEIYTLKTHVLSYHTPHKV